MKKKILATLLIASIVATGLFAKTYSAPNQSAILNAAQAEVPYTFAIDYNDSNQTGVSQSVSGLLLDATGGTTKVFDVETTGSANMENKIAFTTTIKTGEFLDTATSSIQTGWYPTITKVSSKIRRAKGTVVGNEYLEEPVTYTATTEGVYTSFSLGTYDVSLEAGRHKKGSQIASFKLNYKGDANVAAGAYTSTSIITITTDEV